MMQKVRSGTGSVIFYVLVLLILSLTATLGYFYSQNRLYQQKNRALIIQNDSILSVNVELRAALNAMLDETGNRTATLRLTEH